MARNLQSVEKVFVLRCMGILLPAVEFYIMMRRLYKLTAMPLSDEDAG